MERLRGGSEHVVSYDFQTQEQETPLLAGCLLAVPEKHSDVTGPACSHPSAVLQTPTGPVASQTSDF